jgi:Lrp/AsnC family transcriptional regulator, leucine-responsive regulatory protein
VPRDQRIVLDAVDRELVRALVDDGRMSYQQLAARVHLSATSTAERVRRLQVSGVLSGYHAVLDLAVLGRTLHAITDVKIKETCTREDFEAALAAVPQVLSAVHTTGEYDYQLRVASTGTADLQTVVDAVRRMGAREVHSRIVLGEVIFDPTRLLDA